MTTRKGAAKGTGSGYKNLRNYPRDPHVHSASARGIKQPQKIKGMVVVSRYGKDAPVYEVSSTGEVGTPKAQSKVWAGIRAAGSAVAETAKKAASAAAEYAKEYQETQRERERLRREQELVDIQHPAAIKHKEAKETVARLQSRYENAEGDAAEAIQDQLVTANEKLIETEEALENINLAKFNDAELRQLAIRHRDDSSLFGGSSNRYEEELTGRIKYRRALDAKLRALELNKPVKEEGLFDF